MEALPADNYIKRERHRMQEKKKTIHQMRMSLPVYNLDEIREYKLPYDEALMISLEEKGYTTTLSFLKELVDFQSNLREQAGVGTNIWMRPQLIFSKNQLQYLSSGLRSSEDYRKKGNHAQECQTLLELAVHFAFDHIDWWWLGEQLMIRAIKVSTGYTSLGGKYEALSRFAFSKFLIEKVKRYEDALAQLKIARELSIEKGWTSKQYFPEETGTLFMQVNHHLFFCLYRDARHLVKVDARKALELASEARKRAAESCYHEGETKALMLKAMCELDAYDTKTAINSLIRAFNLQNKAKSREGMCKVRVQLAKAYLMDGNTPMALQTLMLLKEDAEEHDLPFYMGQAYKNLGEYYLTSGEPEKANPLLSKAMDIFYGYHLETPDVETVRNLEAISAGMELLPDYLRLIHRTGRKDHGGWRNLMKMVAWKDERRPFWNVEEKVQQHKSLGDIIGESVQTVAVVSRVEMDKQEGKTLKTGEVLEVGKRKVGMVESIVDRKAVIQLHDNKDMFAAESVTGLAGEAQ